MLNKTICFLISAVLIFQLLCVRVSANGIEISAKSAIVMVAATGEVLYSKNEYEKRGMASTTKIMTCVVALENASLSDTVTASEEDVTIEGTSIGLKAGDTVDLFTLLNGMLLESGNDAANVTATLVAGDKEEFARLMNKKAAELGMAYSSFKNPSGLTEDGHYSCAYDMALLGSYAIKNHIFKSICSSEKYVATMGKPSYEATFYNHNKLLDKYDGAVGIKTGFTKASGRCLVSAVEKDGITLVAVTLNAYDDWNDHMKLYDYCFEGLSVSKAEIPLQRDMVSVVNSHKSSVDLKLSEDILIPYKSSVPEYVVSYYLPRFIYADVNKGDYIGWAELHTANGAFIGKTYIVANESLVARSSEPELSLVEKIIKYLEKDRR